MYKYLIHYFSGAGNTYHMVKNMEKELRSRGCEVELLNIEKFTNTRLDNYNFHIFCFPVYGFGTPSIMLRYISGIKALEGCSSAIICTAAGAEGQSLNHCRLLLNRKGFKVVLTDMITYTYNFTQVFNPQSKEKEKQVFKEAEVHITEIINKLINKETYFRRDNIFIIAFFWIFFIPFSTIARRILGKTYIADDTCIGCGKCIKVCPAKAIYMHNGKPRWKSNCESCQRCINICPQKSIQLSIIKFAVFAVSELIPIPIIAYLNNHMIHLNTVINIILFFIMFIANTVIAGVLINIMERSSLIKKLFQINYTKKFRRNLATGFEIK